MPLSGQIASLGRRPSRRALRKEDKEKLLIRDKTMELSTKRWKIIAHTKSKPRRADKRLICAITPDNWKLCTRSSHAISERN